MNAPIDSQFDDRTFQSLDLSSLAALGDMFIESYSHKEPDLIIVDAENLNQLERWHIVRNPLGMNLYLHKVMRDDNRYGLHDHPWPSVSIVLSGTLREVFEDGSRLLAPGSITHRDAETLHRLEVADGPVWTLFATSKKSRDWGFVGADGQWRHSREIVKIDGNRAYSLLPANNCH